MINVPMQRAYDAATMIPEDECRLQYWSIYGSEGLLECP